MCITLVGSKLVCRIWIAWNEIKRDFRLVNPNVLFVDSAWFGFIAEKKKLKPCKRAHQCFKAGLKSWSDMATGNRWKEAAQFQQEFQISLTFAEWAVERAKKAWRTPPWGVSRWCSLSKLAKVMYLDFRWRA